MSVDSLYWFPIRTRTEQAIHLSTAACAGLRTFRSWPREMLKATLKDANDRRWILRDGGELYSPPSHWSSPLACIARDIYRLSALPAVHTFIDIGACIGSFSVAAMKRWPAATGVAYEPIPATFPYLLRNLAMNCAGRVLPVQQAVTGRDGGPLEMAFYPECRQGCTAVRSLMMANVERVQVPATTLAAVLTQSPHTDLLKIDAEGSEYEMLSNTDAELFKSVVFIILEYHPVPQHDPSNIVSRFTSFGFQMQHIDFSQRLMFYRRTHS